jgi:Fanconi anemia group M protein
VRIIFATPQVVKNDPESGLSTLKDFSLLVFDGCYRAGEDYSYTYVAKKYVERAPWPIILGMTAAQARTGRRWLRFARPYSMKR